MTYAEYMQRQREYEREKFARLSDAERLAAWERRQLFLWTNLLTLDKQFVNQIFCCVSCHLVWPIHWWPHWWPSYFECRCGVFMILDKWLPDGIERVTMKTYAQLEDFAREHPKLYDLYGYPFEERIVDLDSSWHRSSGDG